MSNGKNEVINTKFRKKLLEIYPQTRILFDYLMDMSTPIDISGKTTMANAVLINNLGTPIAIFECKIAQSSREFDSLISSGKDLLINCHKNTRTPIFLVIISADENDNINHYYVYRLHPETEDFEKIGWPDFEILQAGIKAKTISEEKVKQKNSIKSLIFKSWIIILIGIILLILDSGLLSIKYVITNERMYFMIFLVILIYLPNISEISFSSFNIKMNREEEKDSEK